jgi:hypothetical protein
MKKQIAAGGNGVTRLSHLGLSEGEVVLAGGGDSGSDVGRVERLLGALGDLISRGVVNLKTAGAAGKNRADHYRNAHYATRGAETAPRLVHDHVLSPVHDRDPVRMEQNN